MTERLKYISKCFSQQYDIESAAQQAELEADVG